MESIATIASALKSGHVGIFPTESSYGLAARVAPDTASFAACAQIVRLKGRREGMAFPVVATIEQLAMLVEAVWAARLLRLVGAGFWPGPLTVAIPARAGLPPHVVDQGRIAVRVPDHDVVIALCNAVGAPLTATSANRSGEPPIVDPRQAALLFPGATLCDGGVLPGGAPSTIVGVNDRCDVTLIREGAVPWSRIENLSEVLRG